MKNDINPALLQHKKDRQAEAKKQRQQKAKENQARLSKLNYWRVKERVDQLETKKRNSNGKLLAREVETLKKLKADLAALEKLHKDKLNTSNTGSSLGSSSSTEKVLQRRILRKENGRGKSSIFWDPILNPYGVPPPGMPNALRNMDNDNEDEEGYETDPEVRNIPLPKGPIPGIDIDSDEERKKKEEEDEADQKIEYSAAPVRRDIVKEVSAFVPASVLRRQMGIKQSFSNTSTPSATTAINTNNDDLHEEDTDQNSRQPRLEDVDDEYEEDDYSATITNGKRKYSDRENDEDNDEQDIYDDEDYEI